MVKQIRTVVIEEVIDDLTGEICSADEARTIKFGWEGHWYEIDLANVIAETFEHLITPYVVAARPLDELPTPEPRLRPKRVRNQREPRQRDFRRETQRTKIRKWAAENGYHFPSPKAPLPQDWVDRYFETHPEEINRQEEPGVDTAAADRWRTFE